MTMATRLQYLRVLTHRVMIRRLEKAHCPEPKPIAIHNGATRDHTFVISAQPLFAQLFEFRHLAVGHQQMHSGCQQPAQQLFFFSLAATSSL